VLNDKPKEDERGRPCNTHGRDEKCIVFWLENLKGGDDSEYVSID